MTITAWLLFSFVASIVLMIASILIKGNGSRAWLKIQFEWVKGFFEETAGQPNKPSHKNLLVIAVIWMFIVAYMRVLATTVATTLPDIPDHWLEFLLGALIIRGAQSVFETRARIKAERDGSQTPPSSTPTH